MNARTSLAYILLFVLIGVVLTALYPLQRTTDIFHQSSPALEQPALFKQSRDSAPLSTQGTIRQRLWIPTKAVTQLTLFVRHKNDFLPSLTVNLYNDINGEQGEHLESLPVTATGSKELTTITINLSGIFKSDNSWVWLEITQNDSTTALLFYRNIDHNVYPGGRLIIDDPPRHQEQGVLAFTLATPQHHWRNPLPILISLLVLVLFTISLYCESSNRHNQPSSML